MRPGGEGVRVALVKVQLHKVISFHRLNQPHKPQPLPQQDRLQRNNQPMDYTDYTSQANDNTHNEGYG